MSVWSGLYGSIIIPKEAHISIRKLAEDIFDEGIFQIKQEGDYFKVDLSFPDEAVSARKSVEQFIQAVKEIKGSYIDIISSVRYLK